MAQAEYTSMIQYCCADRKKLVAHWDVLAGMLNASQSYTVHLWQEPNAELLSLVSATALQEKSGADGLERLWVFCHFKL